MRCRCVWESIVESELLVLSAVAISIAGCLFAIWLAVEDRFGSRLNQRLRTLARGKGGITDPSLMLKDSPQDHDGMWGAIWQSLHDRLNLHLLFIQAGISLSPSQMLLAMGGSALLGGLAGWLSPLPKLFLPLIMLASLSIPLVVLHVLRVRRMQRFARQFPDTLELLARALRAGNSLVVGCQIVSDDMIGPVAVEFGVFCRGQSLGTSLQQGLDQLCSRVPNRDLRFFADCVAMQREMGGNLAEICEKIADIVRERFRILSQVQALTGEGRLSGTVLLALPFVLLLAIYHLSPDYVEVLFTDPLGRKLLAGAAVLQLAGAFCIKKIVDIDV